MNETTRAILRQHLEVLQSALDSLQEQQTLRRDILALNDQRIAALSIQMDDIEAVLNTDAAGGPIGLRSVAGIALTSGETTPSHNG